MPRKPFIITFAGVVGSSKTPVAMYLSAKLGLPIYQNDAVRTEVIEDLLHFDAAEHQRRRDERVADIFQRRLSFIGDASMDHEWTSIRKSLVDYGYDWFIISLDLSRGLLEKLYQAKKYHESRERLDTLLSEHEAFLQAYSEDVALHITDASFSARLEQSFAAVQTWLSSRQTI